MSFWRGVFSEPNGSPSSSRVMMGFHGIVGSVGLLHLIFHNHAAPDPLTIAAIGTFVALPYGINQVKNAINQNPAPTQ